MFNGPFVMLRRLSLNGNLMKVVVGKLGVFLQVVCL